MPRPSDPDRPAPKSPARQSPGRRASAAPRSGAGAKQRRRAGTRPAPRHGPGPLAIALSGLGVALGAGLVALIAGAARRAPAAGEHPAPDLAPDRPHPAPEARAPVDFRPDPTAAVPESERDQFRPALAGVAAPSHATGRWPAALPS